MKDLKINPRITRKDDSIERYLRDVDNIEMIDPEEEVELAQKIKKGDKKSLEKLVNANLRFVISVAKQYQGRGLPLADLINEGNLGLIKAAKKYDETRGFKFISHAVWWIRQSIMHSTATKRNHIKFPESTSKKIAKYNKIKNELSQKLGRIATDQDVLECRNDLSEEISKLSYYSCISINNKIDYGSERDFLEVTPNKDSKLPDEDLVKENIIECIKQRAEKLPKKESVAFKLYYGLNGNKEYMYDKNKIAEEMGINRATVNTYLDKGERRLRNIFKLEERM